MTALFLHLILGLLSVSPYWEKNYALLILSIIVNRLFIEHPESHTYTYRMSWTMPLECIEYSRFHSYFDQSRWSVPGLFLWLYLIVFFCRIRCRLSQNGKSRVLNNLDRSLHHIHFGSLYFMREFLWWSVLKKGKSLTVWWVPK